MTRTRRVVGCVRLAALISVWFVAGAAHAQPAKHNELVGLVVEVAESGWGESMFDRLPKVEEFAAREAVPIKVTMAPGATLREVVTSTCDGPTDSYFDLVRERFEELNPGLEEAGDPLDFVPPDDALTEGREVLLPFCFRDVSAARKQVETGDSVWGYFQATKREAAGDASKGLSDDEASQFTMAQLSKLQRELTWNNFKRVFRELNPGSDPEALQMHQIVKVPIFQPGEITLPMERSRADEIERALRSSLPVRVVGRGGLGSLTSPVDIDMPDACSNPGPPFDRNQVVAQLAENRVLRIRYPDLPRSRSARIIVADTGITHLARVPFVDRLLTLLSYPDRGQEIASDEGYGDREHGDYVASLAVGGVGFLPVDTLLDPPLELSMFKLVEAYGNGAYGYPLDRLDSVARASDAVGGAVVNLSVRFEERLDNFYQAHVHSDETTRSLFVVAAGNERSRMTTGDWYPARYGGEFRNNLITVSALDGDALARFSNYSDEFVDIAAPGCDLEVPHRNGSAGVSRIKRSGTSLAAPLVSFAAGLVRRELYELSANAVKRRLLYSARIDPNLEKDVGGGRILDIPRALALFTDLVELKGGRQLKGRVEFTLEDAGTVDFCGDARYLERDRLRRLAFLSPESPVSPVRILWEDTDGRPETEECPGLPGSLRVTDRFTGEVEEVPLTEVVDVVFAEKPYWES